MADKKKAGAKSKYETHILPFFDKIEKLLNDGASERQVAKSLGVSYASFNNYKVKYKELGDLCRKPRTKLVEDLRSALVKKALGYTYEEKEQYIEQEIDPQTKKPTGKKVMKTKIVTRHQPPDTTAIFGALNIYDDDYVKDKKQYELKQQELELRKMIAENKDW
ncbi:MAG: hypothetical protein ACI4MS_08275 [Candidatus Coproplasma sp.]